MDKPGRFVSYLAKSSSALAIEDDDYRLTSVYDSQSRYYNIMNNIYNLYVAQNAQRQFTTMKILKTHIISAWELFYIKHFTMLI